MNLKLENNSTLTNSHTKTDNSFFTQAPYLLLPDTLSPDSSHLLDSAFHRAKHGVMWDHHFDTHVGVIYCVLHKISWNIVISD